MAMNYFDINLEELLDINRNLRVFCVHECYQKTHMCRTYHFIYDFGNERRVKDTVDVRAIFNLNDSIRSIRVKSIMFTNIIQLRNRYPFLQSSIPSNIKSGEEGEWSN